MNGNEFFILGQMEINIKAIGKMESKMVKVYTIAQLLRNG
jgi:hypothetical protein